MLMQNLSKVYDPKKTESKIYKFWEKGNFFRPTLSPKTYHLKPYVIVIPPPNITGSLHMGHALNSTVQDILIRKARMEGKPTLWVPGTDHAGIATQNVVEKELAKEGKTRFDLGREKFVRRVWQWKEKYGHIIIEQLKKLGCSCDWSRERFTMDKGYSEAVKEAFLHYQKKNWIYQGERVINWCPRCQTSLSDLELEYKEIKGKLWFVKYKIQNAKCKSQNDNPKLKNDYLVVATTRPETMLGDTAVAVNPKDDRYKDLVGKKVILPLIERQIPIVTDRLVDPSFGTGAVKVTPAHDPNDFEIAERHNLPKIKVINEQGKITERGEKYAGLARFEAREKILKDLEKLGLLKKTENYLYSVPHCYRCGTIIEQILSKQWFIKMDELKKPAIEVVKQGKIKFVPNRFKKVYLDWMKNLKDWCISRQIWWGHRLPVWQSELKTKNSKLKTEYYIGDNPPKGYVQVEDVLDTWFSSALWPIAIFLKKNGSKSKLKTQNEKLKKTIDIFGQDLITDDLAYFYPTTVLCTAREILFLWVARMVFSGLEFMGKIPFETVYIHPVVLAETGKKMSKSLGTGVDPLLLIEKYGADATRFGIAWQLTGLQDLRFKEDTMVAARNFCNKIWNATRFVLQQISNSKLKTQNSKPQPKTQNDKRILSKLNQTIKQINKDLSNFRFGQAAQALYRFFWHEFCDKYIEKSKAQMTNDKLRDSTLSILCYVLTTCLKLLHPFMPFITEEIWQKLPGKEPLIVSKWPR